MIITLEPWEYEWASQVGMRRVTQHLGKNDDQNYYANNNKQPEILANIASCCGEMATAKALKKYWSGHVWDQRDHSKYKHLPDVEPNIEVRRIRERTSKTSVVRKKDVANDTVLTYDNVPFFVRLANDVQEYSIITNDLYSYEVDLIESL